MRPLFLTFCLVLFFYILLVLNSKSEERAQCTLPQRPRKSCIKRHSMAPTFKKSVRFSEWITIYPAGFSKKDRFNPQLATDMMRNVRDAKKLGSFRQLAQQTLRSIERLIEPLDIRRVI